MVNDTVSSGDGGDGGSDRVNHPAHYGGEGNPYEAILVIEAWDLGFCLGNAVKYIARAGKKGDALEDLKKARWYLDRFIRSLESERETREVMKASCEHAMKISYPRESRNG